MSRSWRAAYESAARPPSEMPASQMRVRPRGRHDVLADALDDRSVGEPRRAHLGHHYFGVDAVRARGRRKSLAYEVFGLAIGPGEQRNDER
jgi:hypothetical protein